jgi:hypothetical protein
MPKTYPVINSFNSGELSELCDFREDVTKYHAGCKVLENAYPLVEGGAKKMPGTYYVTGTKNNGKVRLEPFSFSTSQTYILEFGNLYIRFYTNNGQIVSSYSAWITSYWYNCGRLVTNGGNYYRCIVAHASGTFATDLAAGKWALTNGATDLAYEIPTPYIESDLFDLDVDTQSADELYIFHHSYPPATLQRLSASLFILLNPLYIGTSNIAKLSTIAKNIQDIQQISGNPLIVNAPRYGFKFGQRVYISGVVGMVEVNNKVFTAGNNAGTGVTAYNPATAYGGGTDGIGVGNWAEFDFGGGRSLYIACPYGSWDGTKAEITLTSNTTDNLSVTIIGNHITILLASTTSSKNSAALIQAAIIALSTDNKILDLGGLDDSNFHWTVTENAAYVSSRPTSAFGSITQILTNEENAYSTSAGASAGTFPPISNLFTVYNPAMDGTLFHLTGTTTSSGSSYISGGLAVAIDYLFDASGDYPSCGTLYEQRLIEAGSDNEADKLYGSVQGDYPVFICDPNSEDYSIQFSLVSPKVDPILNVIGSPNGLLIGTASGIWVMSGTNGAALTQNNVQASKQTSIGVGKLSPQLVNDSVIFVSRSLRETMFLVFNFSTNQWDNIDLTRLNRSITLGDTKETSGIIQTAFQAEPNPIFWAVRADGQFPGLVFNKQDQVYAWFRINMIPEGGYIESAACIPQQDDEDQVWVSVQRTINGSTVRYIEYFMPQEIFGQLENAFFVHCGLQLNMGSSATITAITQAIPCSVHAPSHGFTNGATVRITDVMGMTQINQTPSHAYTITYVDADNFTLNGSDSTLWTAYLSGGTAIPVTNRVTGMGYLQGQNVVAVGDGCKIFTGIVPATGILNFSTYANLITVGLPYKMTVQPMNPILSSNGQTSRGQKQKLNRVTVSIYQGMGGQMGIDKDNLFDIEYGNSSVGSTPSMFTGEISRDVQGDFDDKSEFIIENEEPFPFTLRGIVFRLSVNQD